MSRQELFPFNSRFFFLYWNKNSWVGIQVRPIGSIKRLGSEVLYLCSKEGFHCLDLNSDSFWSFKAHYTDISAGLKSSALHHLSYLAVHQIAGKFHVPQVSSSPQPVRKEVERNAKHPARYSRDVKSFSGRSMKMKSVIKTNIKEFIFIIIDSILYVQ